MLRENKKEAAQIEQPNKDSNKNSVADELDEMCRKLQRAADPTYLDSFTMEELYDQVFESRPSIIEGLLTAGTYILAGVPKLGKSFLVMQFAWHVSTGTPLWDMPVKPGHVLYFALEDDKRRLQTRLHRMVGEIPTDKLHLTVCSQSIGNGLLLQIEHFLEDYPDTRLIIVDTLQKVREMNKEQYSYAGDYTEIAELKKISDKYSVCILLVHHTRKQQADDGFDMISGTSGLMGAADGALLLRKERRTANTASLDISGRDQQDQRLYLKRDEESLCWELESMETEVWKEAPEPILERLASFLDFCGQWSGSPTELVQALGVDMNADSLEYDEYFFAKHAEGYELTVEYYGCDVIYIEIYDPYWEEREALSDGSKADDRPQNTAANINSYKILLGGNLGGNFLDSDISVDINELDDEEKSFVHDFLLWDNADKNLSLGNVVYSCLEYCLLVSGDSPNALMKGIIRNRVIYLDTNVIFRALGINGEARKKVIHAFLKKCQQAKVKLVILSQTKKEFFETTNIYIANIEKFPRGVVNPEAYEYFADYNLYEFYSLWHYDHPTLSLKYFRLHLESIYDEFVKQYSIVDEEKIPPTINTSHEFGPICRRYAQSIQQKKQEHRAERNLAQDINPNNTHDATIIRYIEMMRDMQVDEKDVFLVSTDKVLRSWDMGRTDVNYPVVVYPSQLFIILVKLCGRSDDDFESFVNFINIPSQTQQITAEKANIIVSGISSITEDLEKQIGIVKAAYGGEFQRIIQHSHSDMDLYQSVQQYSMNYLKDELGLANSQLGQAQQVIDEQTGKIKDLQAKVEESTNQVDKASKDEVAYKEEITKLTNHQEEQREKICKFVEKKVKPLFCLRWYIIPAVILLYLLSIVSFVVLQLFWCDKQWNFVTELIQHLSTTTFWKNIPGPLFVIDSAAFVFGGVLLKYIWRNPCNKAAQKEDLLKLVTEYIEEHDLM